jgi:hypothetical protein
MALKERLRVGEFVKQVYRHFQYENFRDGRHCKVGAQEVAISDSLDPVSVQKALKGSFPAAVLETQRNGRALKSDEQAEDLLGAVFSLPRRMRASSPDKPSTWTAGRTCTERLPPAKPKRRIYLLSQEKVIKKE